MASPDHHKTITCICGVYRAHIAESTRMDAHALDLITFCDAPAHAEEAHEKEEDRNQEHEHEQQHQQQRSQRDTHVPPLNVIVDFVTHVFQKGKLEPECLITSLVYIERLMRHSRGRVRPHPTNWKSVLFSALVLASKMLDDMSMWNVDFANLMNSSNSNNNSSSKNSSTGSRYRSISKNISTRSKANAISTKPSTNAKSSTKSNNAKASTKSNNAKASTKSNNAKASTKSNNRKSNSPFTLERINQLEVYLLQQVGYHVKVRMSEYGKYFFLLRSMWLRNEKEHGRRCGGCGCSHYLDLGRSDDGGIDQKRRSHSASNKLQHWQLEHKPLRQGNQEVAIEIKDDISEDDRAAIQRTARHLELFYSRRVCKK